LKRGGGFDVGRGFGGAGGLVKPGVEGAGEVESGARGIKKAESKSW